MIAVDTNVVLRFIAADNSIQYRQSYQLFSNKADIYLSDTVLLECASVLQFSYKQTPFQVASVFRKIAGLPNVTIETPDALISALDWHEQGLDFADALHLAKARRLDQFITFDQKFINRAAQIHSGCDVVSAADASKSL